MKKIKVLQLGIASILLLCAVFIRCDTNHSPKRQQYEVFYDELDSAEKAWIDISKMNNKLHDSITWFNVWFYAHAIDSPGFHRWRLYFPQHNKIKK